MRLFPLDNVPAEAQKKMRAVERDISSTRHPAIDINVIASFFQAVGIEVYVQAFDLLCVNGTGTKQEKNE